MKLAYKFLFGFSLTLVVVATVLLFSYGLNLGVDFVGGSVLEVEFTDGRPPVQDIVDAFTASEDKVVQAVTVSAEGENRIVVRSADTSGNTHDALTGILLKKWPDAGIKERQFDFIGPAIGSELKSKSVRAIVFVLIAVVLYIAFVFRAMRRVLSPWVLGTAALVALAHDVLIPLGVFAVLGHVANVQINAVLVAAALTVLGYSVSDTVVIFDRVRENIIRGTKGTFAEIVHLSVTQTLVRSLNTTLTTLVALVAILLFGGASVHYFALALILGIGLGAYSSIGVAAPILMWIGRARVR